MPTAATLGLATSSSARPPAAGSATLWTRARSATVSRAPARQAQEGVPAPQDRGAHLCRRLVRLATRGWR